MTISLAIISKTCYLHYRNYVENIFLCDHFEPGEHFIRIYFLLYFYVQLRVDLFHGSHLGLIQIHILHVLMFDLLFVTSPLTE